MLVPEGIAAEDACYLPAVETALSLVQDASPIVGENIAVYGQVSGRRRCCVFVLARAVSLTRGPRGGADRSVACGVRFQGMIGLLVTAILSRTFGPDKVFAVEMNPDR